MKTKYLIIEDNFSKFFSTKQILESQLSLEVKTVDVANCRELVGVTSGLHPDVVMFRPNGGVADLLLKMKKRKANRRNTEVTLLLAQDFEDEAWRFVQALVAGVAMVPVGPGVAIADAA